MANEVTVFSTCRACKGSGIDRRWQDDGQGGGEWIEQDCENCSATGKISAVDGLVNTDVTISGDFFDDVMDKLNDIKKKVDEIKEVVDEL